jgi:hypothetical protein
MEDFDRRLSALHANASLLNCLKFSSMTFYNFDMMLAHVNVYYLMPLLAPCFTCLLFTSLQQK